MKEKLLLLILALFIITGLPQASEFYSVSVTKSVGFCPTPHISENCTFAENTTTFWAPYPSYVFVQVNVTNTGKLPISGFLWDIIPKNTYLLTSTINVTPIEKITSNRTYINTTYITTTDYTNLMKITGPYFNYFPGVDKLTTLPNKTEEDYKYILVGFASTGEYRFIILNPNETLSLSYFIFLNSSGTYDLGRAIFTT